MEVTRPRSATVTRSTSLVAAALLLVGSWSSQAIGASWSKSDCPESSDKTQPEMTLDTLMLDPVDHTAIEPGHTEFDDAAVADATSEQVTPFLYLAPRVASAIRDVFGEDKDQAEAEESPTSPLAERDDVTPYPSSVDNKLPETGDLDSASLPQLQRQMYRIDI